MRRQRARALLVDLDGVLRHIPVNKAQEIERRYGMEPGRLRQTASVWGRMQPALVGEVSHAQWMSVVADELAFAAGGPERARAAVAEWQAERGTVDQTVLSFVRDVRAAGLPVGIATNGTDALGAELDALGLTGEVDVVVNSSEVGAHKPAKEFFLAACQAIGVPPPAVFFIDADDRAVRGARAAGLSALRWSGPDDLRYVRAALEV
ncbi:HAD family hydrolase [Catenuloplanes atrovinosus]|uniref:Hydrolase of the HAD superfamily n=1 Tax=Catenuloplanes atrovinosus TaxID=137266 RepID=A0AAE3YH24_9ACTN|nr:HAD family hydrolase [Catenuloplanes atrovinosus]MDR7273305.1 putative hydrolase of the HAD superfamily [Catenuloplanes atrovinosus]